jgi:hypothetical protein
LIVEAEAASLSSTCEFPPILEICATVGHSDALSRRALLDTARPIAANLLESSGQPPAAAPDMHSSSL